QQGKATLLCLAEELTVPLVQVSWAMNGTSVTDGIGTSPPVQQPDKTLRMSSSVTVSASIETAMWISCAKCQLVQKPQSVSDCYLLYL
uniref:Ig-like domain-containing protein n=1 Tax=Pygocentrus nattereri TaxID=42514 RepID=A0AAR2IN38_PYGNA